MMPGALELRRSARAAFELLSITAAGVAGFRSLLGAPAIESATRALGLVSDLAGALFVVCVMAGIAVRGGRWLRDRAAGLQGKGKHETSAGRSAAEDVPAPARPRHRRDDDPVLPLPRGGRR